MVTVEPAQASGAPQVTAAPAPSAPAPSDGEIPVYSTFTGSVELVDIKRVLKESDFITLHLPLNAKTRKMIGAKELALFKPNARIINCARGGLIDEEALVEAIREGKIAGAAIDVFEQEPITESILFNVDNIIVTPHLGASTAEAQVLAAQDVAEQIVDVFKGLPARSAGCGRSF